MVVRMKVGRRVPRNWLRRTAFRTKGLFTFQENIWLIIDRSLVLAKRKCAQTPDGGIFLKKTYREPEDINYDIEWIEIEYHGNPMQEDEEHKEMLDFYKPMGNLFKEEMPKNPEISKHFLTNKLTQSQLDNTYKMGFGAISNRNLSQKLLDLGIVTYIEKQEI